VLRPSFEIASADDARGPLILDASGAAYWRELRLERTAPETPTWLVSASADGTVRYRVPIDRAWAFTGWVRAADLLVATAHLVACPGGDATIEARRTSDGGVAWSTPLDTLFPEGVRGCITPSPPAVAGTSIVIQARSCDASETCDFNLAWLDAQSGSVQRVVAVRPSASGTSEMGGAEAQPAVDAASNVYVVFASEAGSRLVSYAPGGSERYRVETVRFPSDVVVATGLAIVKDGVTLQLPVHRAADGSRVGELQQEPPIVMLDGLFGLRAEPVPLTPTQSSGTAVTVYRADPQTFEVTWTNTAVGDAPDFTTAGAAIRTSAGALLFHRDDHLPFDARPASRSPAWLHEHDASGEKVFAVELPGDGLYDPISALGSELWWAIETRDDGSSVVRAFRLPGRSPATTGRVTAFANMARDGAEH
jgi:hypothetical protein